MDDLIDQLALSFGFLAMVVGVLLCGFASALLAGDKRRE